MEERYHQVAWRRQDHFETMMMLGETNKFRKEFSIPSRIPWLMRCVLTVAWPLDTARLPSILLESSSRTSSSSSILTWLGRTKTPYLGLHLKYGFPCTDPSFFPLASNLGEHISMSKLPAQQSVVPDVQFHTDPLPRREIRVGAYPSHYTVSRGHPDLAAHRTIACLRHLSD